MAFVCVLATLAGDPALAFGASPVRRDPFWPLGYVPAVTNAATVAVPVGVAPPEPVAVVTKVTEKHWEDAERVIGIQPVKYSVAGSAAGGNVVLLGGRFKSEGDLVLLDRNGVRFTWLVASISRDTVRFERRTADILSIQGTSAKVNR